MSASPIVAEAIGSAGFEWGVIDMEHTPLDLMDLVHLLQAVGNTKMLPVVRVPWPATRPPLPPRATPLPCLDVLAEDDVWSYGPAQSEHSDGLDWRRPDSTSRAALGLRSRCDAADLYAAALLTDPIYRRRAVHTGHVVTGTAKPLGDKLKRVEVTCTRLDSRLRPGNALTGWVLSLIHISEPTRPY